jgi:hypothetical protein
MPKTTPHRFDANGTELKRCSKCTTWTALGEYHRDKTKEDGLRPKCKECRKTDCLKYYKENREKVLASHRKYNKQNEEKIAIKKREYREINKEKIAVKKQKYYQENRSKINCKCRKYYQQNKEKCLESIRKYHEENKEKITDYRRKYFRERRKEDPQFRLTNNIRGALGMCLKKARLEKNDRTFKYISCSPSFLLERLEKMRIERGLTEYHIDHMMPLSSFDLSDPKQLRRAWHFSNLQLLSAVDNLKKSNKIIYDMKWARDEWVIRTMKGNGLYRPTALFRSLLLV